MANLQPHGASAVPAPAQAVKREALAREAATPTGWLRDFFPGYFARVMGTGVD